MDQRSLFNPSSGQKKNLTTVLFVVVAALAGILRFHGLGERSLWADELCTWKVSQMPLGDALRWQPELTKPPLYQLTLRSFSESGNLSEAQLRLPAAICGTLAVAAIWWLGSQAGGWTVGASAALLFAVQSAQLDYSQEARPYTMLVLGSIASTGLWYRINSQRSALSNPNGLPLCLGYALVVALTFHANYLVLLTLAAHAAWSVIYLRNQRKLSSHNSASLQTSLGAPFMTLGAVAALCVPMVAHFLRYRTSVFQGLDWIPDPTLIDAVTVLAEISFAALWVVLLAASIAAWAFFRYRLTHPMGTLLVVWLGTSWLGLLLISWLAHPAMVARYALPATAPAILFPLLILHRIDHRLPLAISLAFVVGTAPEWLTRSRDFEPGFRELVAFLDQHADPQREVVVAVVDRASTPGWEDTELLGFEYYQSSKFKIKNQDKSAQDSRTNIEILYLRGGAVDGDQPVLRDTRALWLVSFLADPTGAIASAGRRTQEIAIEDQAYSQLLFAPYRLMRVAPMD